MSTSPLTVDVYVQRHRPRHRAEKLLVARASMTGLVVFDYACRYQQAIAELSGWVSQGRLRSVEDTVPGGIEMFPGLLARLFSGQNAGKLTLELRA